MDRQKKTPIWNHLKVEIEQCGIPDDVPLHVKILLSLMEYQFCLSPHATPKAEGLDVSLTGVHPQFAILIDRYCHNLKVFIFS